MLVFEGCAPGPTTVSGTITLDHRTISVPAAAQGTIIFQPDGGRGTISTGLLDSTGNFQLATGSSMEVAPGKYSVTVAVSELAPKSDDEEQGTQLITPAKYASARNSDLKADVKPGANRIDFDLTSGAADETATSQDSPKPGATASSSGEKPAGQNTGEKK
jgi:hypothetical protein